MVRVIASMSMCLILGLLSILVRGTHADQVKCQIPNMTELGECRPSIECKPFRRFNNVHSSATAKVNLEFLNAIQCDGPNGDDVCCPVNGSNYGDVRMSELCDATSRTNENCPCGQPVPAAKVQGGKIASIDEFPWMAMLIYKNEGSAGCGGSLISSSFVVTAAHCLIGRVLQELGALEFVRVGEYDLHNDPDCVVVGNQKDCTDGKIDYTPKRIIPHPEYSGNTPDHHHDIGLIQLWRRVLFTDFIQPICLPEWTDRQPVKYSVAGWGRTNHFSTALGYNMPSPVMLKAKLSFVTRDECQQSYASRRINLGEAQLCAGGGRSDSCTGDSGSPLMSLHRMGFWVLSGVVSLGEHICGTEGKPGIYTDVKRYIAWIREEAGLRD